MTATQMIVPIPTETRRDCIVVDGRVWCERDRGATPGEIGAGVLAFVAVVAWCVLPIVWTDLSDRFSWWGWALWYAGPPVLLGLALLGWPR